MLKVITVVGARPQFIKASVVSRVFQQYANIQELIIHTGQHYDESMSDVFFQELDIPKPVYNLGVGGGHHGSMTAKMLEGLEILFLKHRPDWVLVYGDTNSTLAASLAASKLNIKIAHVESGLRSFNRKMPEEVNRVLTDHLSSVLFAPTALSVENLSREGIVENVVQSGDVMFDSVLYFGSKGERNDSLVEKLGLKSSQFIVATCHRPENTDNKIKLNNIFSALIKAAKEYRIVMPIHPRTIKCLEKKGLLDKVRASVDIIDPVGYFDMLCLLENAILVLTDSGGLQKEAFFSGTPCITVREQTEWLELVDSGWNILLPPRCPEDIYQKIKQTIGTQGSACDVYGDGKASEKIVQALIEQS